MIQKSDQCQCPWCSEYFDPGLSKYWDIDGFNVRCEHCGKPISVDVEITDYEYTVTKDE